MQDNVYFDANIVDLQVIGFMELKYMLLLLGH